MSTSRFLLAGCLAFAAAACTDSVAPDAADRLEARAALGNSAGSNEVVLMTQNLYVGADVDQVLLALTTPDPDDDLTALLGAIATLERTHFPTRATALAATIRRTRPHAVALQELSLVEIALPPLGLDLRIDFLPILQQALAAEGLDYRVAAQVQNIDASPTPGVRQVDWDALLVDADRVRVNSAAGYNFSNNVGPLAPGVTLIRGWVVANVTIRGRKLNLVSTHLEPDLGTIDNAELRALQIGEITAALRGKGPAVVMGDLNDLSGSPMYRTIRRAGYADVWATLAPSIAGLTDGHAADLSNATPTFDKRIDYIFAKGFDRGERKVVGEMRRFGINPEARPVGPLGPIWISDHAGLLATLRLPAVE